MTIIISSTLNGAQIADGLDGGGTGFDFTQIINGQYAPIINKALNTGRKDLYIRHDLAAPIINCQFYLAEFGENSGHTYGGSDTKTNDYNLIVDLGNNSGSSKNNLDGLSGGLWIDFRAICTDTVQFDKTNYSSKITIVGDNGTEATNQNNTVLLKTDALVYDNSGETAASSPVAGTIGVSGNGTLGDNAHIRLRFYLPSSFAESGVFQGELIMIYSEDI